MKNPKEVRRGQVCVGVRGRFVGLVPVPRSGVCGLVVVVISRGVLVRRSLCAETPGAC